MKTYCKYFLENTTIKKKKDFSDFKTEHSQEIWFFKIKNLIFWQLDFIVFVL